MNRELIVHIHSIIGILIFVTGLLQIVLKKSGSVHKTIGKVYVCAWLVLLITGAYLGGLIITTIGIFGFYFALTGSRIGHLKNKPITLFEKAIFIIGGLVALSMLYFSASLYLKGQSSFAIIFAIFGTIFLFTTANDISKYIFKKPLKKQPYGTLDWYFEHFKRMCIFFFRRHRRASIPTLFKSIIY